MKLWTLIFALATGSTVVSAVPYRRQADPMAGLSACSQKCLSDTVSAKGCTGPTDTACICTSGFTADATPCVVLCPDVAAVIAAQKAMCANPPPPVEKPPAETSKTTTEEKPPAQTSTPSPPSAGVSDEQALIDAGIPECSRTCLLQSAASAKCAGIADTACICGGAFLTAASNCIRTEAKCPETELPLVLALSQKMCTPAPPAPTEPPKCRPRPANARRFVHY